MTHLLGEARLGCGAIRNCLGVLAVECKEDRPAEEERRETFAVDVKTGHSFDISYEEFAALMVSID